MIKMNFKKLHLKGIFKNKEFFYFIKQTLLNLLKKEKNRLKLKFMDFFVFTKKIFDSLFLDFLLIVSSCWKK